MLEDETDADTGKNNCCQMWEQCVQLDLKHFGETNAFWEGALLIALCKGAVCAAGFQLDFYIAAGSLYMQLYFTTDDFQDKRRVIRPVSWITQGDAGNQEEHIKECAGLRREPPNNFREQTTFTPYIEKALTPSSTFLHEQRLCKEEYPSSLAYFSEIFQEGLKREERSRKQGSKFALMCPEYIHLRARRCHIISTLAIAKRAAGSCVDLALTKLAQPAR
eukprot:1145617-Pelagomonas_calceolata.AAC.13